jgi:hypothetical protein
MVKNSICYHLSSHDIRKKYSTSVSVPAPNSIMADIDAQVEYHGSCQCGQVAYKVSLSVALESPQSRITNCDCSICTRNGYHIVYVPRLSVIWIRGWDKLKNFRFNKNSVDHKFCPDCGSSVVIDPCCFYKDMDGFQDGPDILGLNVSLSSRCF